MTQIKDYESALVGLRTIVECSHDSIAQGIAKEVADVLTDLERRTSMVPVSERLPTESGRVGVYCAHDGTPGSGSYDVVQFNGKTFQFNWSRHVTHWWPVPEDPS